MTEEWAILPFERCIEKVTYTQKIKRKEVLQEGKHPVISQEADFINGFWNDDAHLFKVYKPIILFGDHTRSLKYVDFDFVLGADGVKILQPQNFLDPKFFYYQLMSIDLPMLGYARHYRLLKEIEIRFPPLPEQRRIASLAETALSGIEIAIANTKRNLQNVHQILGSYIHFSLRKCANKWPKVTLDMISKNLDHNRIPTTKRQRISGDYPYYGASGIIDYVSDFIFEGDNLLVSEDGANLLARSTPVAFSVTGKYWVNNHAHILNFENITTQKYVEFFLESIKLDQYITGAAQPKLNQKALNSIPIYIPQTIEEQARIVTSIEEIKHEAAYLENIYERKFSALEELKRSVLRQAFNWEL